MTHFHIKIDNKFDEVIVKMKKKSLKLNDIIELKSYIYDTYRNENNIEDTNISRCYNKIDFRI